MGQLAKVISSQFNIKVEQYNKIQGLPFKSSEIETKIDSMLGGNS